MVCSCSVVNCSNRSTSQDNKVQKITFHRFPLESNTRQKWVQFTQRDKLKSKNWQPAKWSTICSVHFASEDFEVTDGPRRLRSGVVPSKNPFVTNGIALPTIDNEPAIKESEANSITTFTHNIEKSNESVRNLEDSASNARKTQESNTDHNYGLHVNPRTLKRKISTLEERVRMLEKQQKNAARREKRLRITVESLLTDLQREKHLREDATARLATYAELPIDLLSSPNDTGYSKRQREFALSLYCCSTKAYSLVEKYIPLPCVRTLRRWTSTLPKE